MTRSSSVDVVVRHFFLSLNIRRGRITGTPMIPYNGHNGAIEYNTNVAKTSKKFLTLFLEIPYCHRIFSPLRNRTAYPT